jgi:predicted extracellular nuclease
VPPSSARRRVAYPLLVTGVLLAGGAVAVAGPADASAADLVVSQVYGGGGNSGATYTHDFVELHNRGGAPVDVTGWSVQYAAAAGTSWQVTRLSGTVQPGRHYLVQEAKGAGGTTPLPTPDATGAIALAGTAGKVALVRAEGALSCGASCAGAAGVQDFVGYGGANEAEGTPVPALSNTTAAVRTDAADSDDNSHDFTVGAPTPRNGGGAEPSPSTSPSPSPSTSPTPAPGRPVRIHDVQGRAHRSPLTGLLVAAPGVVTAVAPNGFWMQDPEPDADPATSEGVFVFTSAKPTVTRGDAVSVTGTVTEFRPGGAGGTNNLTTTELSRPTVQVTGTGVDTPAPTQVGPGGREAPPAVRTDSPGDVETAAAFDPAANGLDFYESLEGMLVRVTDAVATGPTASFGEIPVLPGGAGGPRTGRGGVVYSYADSNTERVFLDDVLAKLPTVDVGAVLGGPVDGVLDYGFGNYKLEVLATPTASAKPLAREVTRAQRWHELAVATFNVENLDPTDPAEKFARLAAVVTTNLAKPDILTVEEIQDDNGATDDGTVTAGATYGRLIDAIVAAGGPRYAYRQIDPENKTDGGEPGGNIRVGFLFNPSRVSFVDRPGGTATAGTGVVRRGLLHAALTLSPGRIDPANPAFADSRKPLAGEFTFHGGTVFVIANHFGSKGGDQPLNGRFQPPARSSESKRHEQAKAVRGFVDKILAVNPNANIVALGDLNDFEFSDTAGLLTEGGALTDLPATLPLAERYSYVFEGNSQVLDHILVSRWLACSWLHDYDIVHVNSEYADQVSDHDPQVVRLTVLPLS